MKKEEPRTNFPFEDMEKQGGRWWKCYKEGGGKISI